ncbi:MAG: ABC transporter permease [Bacilli bacterium]|nr:ABC transporter permease [Bacilli bacterium]
MAEILFSSLGETLLMTLISTFLAYVIGLPIGILLNITSKKGLIPNRPVNLIVGGIVNILRSIPCLLLIVILIPLSNLVLGKGNWSGNWSSMIIPLTFAAFGFVSRVVEQSLAEVDSGVVEAARSLGATNRQIVFKVLLPEARSSLITGLAVTTVSIIGYTAFAGNIAAGGLIAQSFNFGYYNDDSTSMWICLLFVILIVQVIQEGCLLIAKKIDKRRKI